MQHDAFNESARRTRGLGACHIVCEGLSKARDAVAIDLSKVGMQQ